MERVQQRDLILVVGHGSGEQPEEGGESVRRLGAQLEARLGARVAVGFLRQDPKLEEVLGALLDTLDGDLVVLPMMMAEGFGAREVRRRVGALMGQRGEKVKWGRVVGAHSGMERVVEGSLERVATQEITPWEEISVVVVGHGTGLIGGSGDVVMGLVTRLRERGRWGSVDAGFLEQAPRLAGLQIGVLPGRLVVVVPYMAGEGPHTTKDIPEAVGLESGTKAGLVWGKRVVCARAVGAERGVIEVALACVQEAFEER